MKAQQPHKNTVQLVALATTAAPSTWQKIMFWNIDGAAKHLFIAAVNCVTNFFGLISNLHYRTVVDYFTFSNLENKI